MWFGRKQETVVTVIRDPRDGRTPRQVAVDRAVSGLECGALSQAEYESAVCVAMAIAE